jgi:IS5 family transposase
MQYTFFDKADRLAKITKMGDSLERLNAIVDWQVFAPVLEQAIPRETGTKGGRPPFDRLLMFKVLIIKRLYNLSYGQTEYQINDRISFMRFLGMDFGSAVPDANTIWLYEEALSKSEAGKDIFDSFFEAVLAKGYVTRAGSIVDASFIEAPKRRNTKEQREKLKSGGTPDEWAGPAHPQKLMQRDTDAAWTKKGNEAHFGYKDTVKVDLESKLITGYEVAAASASDVKAAEGIFDGNDKVAYGDAAYPSLVLPAGVENQISEKPNRNRPLTEAQKENNHKKAKKRCRVEHVFAGMVQMCGGTSIRCKNKKRAVFNISMLNLVYNMRRVLSLENPTENWVKRKERLAMGQLRPKLGDGAKNRGAAALKQCE